MLARQLLTMAADIAPPPSRASAFLQLKAAFRSAPADTLRLQTGSETPDFLPRETQKMPNPLKRVKNWLYHLDDIDNSRAEEIGKLNIDLIVIDYANSYLDGARPYTSVELTTMRGSSNKLILSYISIGEAEDYRPYWQSSWKHKPPIFLSAFNPEWPDNYRVKYWEKDWQDIIFKYVDDIIKAGFDGLYMDIVDGFQYWEEIAPHTGIDYQQEMANFVAAIRARAETALARIGDKREFVLIGQNGEELITNAKYLAAIDGIAKEDLRFYYPKERESSFNLVPTEQFEKSKQYLEMAKAKEIEVFVVEYMTKARQIEYACLLKSEIDYLNAKGISIYIAEDRDLSAIYEQPAGLNRLNTPLEPSESAPASGADRMIDTEEPERSEDGRGSGQVDGWVGDDKPYWGSRFNIVDGRADADAVPCGGSNDSIYGRSRHGIFYGDDRNDRVDGGAGDASLIGGWGNCTLFGDVVRDLFGGPARLLVEFLTARATVDTAVGETLCYADGRSTDLVDGVLQEINATLLL
jgi:cysteinyl-tRNA synthetase